MHSGEAEGQQCTDVARMSRTGHGGPAQQIVLALSQVRLVASYRSRGWCSTARRRMPWPWHSMALAHTSYRSRGWCSTAPHAKYLHCRQRSLGSSLGGLRRKPCDSAASQSRPRWPRAAATSLAGPAPRQLPPSGLASAAGRQREEGCSQCGWQTDVGQCRLCRSWLCSWHRTMSHVPSQPKRLGGIDCQCEDWKQCRVRTGGKS